MTNIIPKDTAAAVDNEDIRSDVIGEVAADDIHDDKESQKVERVSRLLSKLDSSQDSIVGASSYILQICGKAPSFAIRIVDLMTERMLSVTGPEKVSLVYLINDLIQRSKIRQQGPPFFELFRP